MANNEDYLDSLLKAAESQDNPNSAINKVREITKREQEAVEASKEEISIEEQPVEELPIEELPVEELTVEELPTEELPTEELPTEELHTEELSAEELSAEELPIEELNIEDLPIEDLPTEELAVEEQPAEEISLEELPAEELPVEELPIEDIPIEDIPIEELPVEDIPTEEIPAEDASLEDVSLDDALSDLASLGDLSLDDVSETAENSDNPVETAVDDLLGALNIDSPETGDESSEQSSESSLDDLLNSDFSGEIELGEEDIASLLENAEAFANSDSEEPKGEDDNGLDSSTEASVDDLLGSLNFDAPNENGEIAVDLSDIDSLAGELGFEDKDAVEISGDSLGGDNGELEEISSLLNTIDSNEVKENSDDDLLSLLSEAVSEQEAVENREALLKDREQAELEYAKFKEEKEKQEAKEKKKASSFLTKIFGKKKEKEESGEELAIEKPKSKFSKIVDFLTASEDDDEAEEDLLKVQDAEPEAGKEENFEDVPGENKEILEEIDAEGEDGKGKKGKKKKKDKKGKKGKKGKETSTEEGDESDDEESAEGEGKKKKAKKEKKERKPLVLDIDTGKPLSKRNVKLVGFLAATLLLAIILIAKFVPSIFVNASARRAYYRGDYETTYNSFYGEKLNSSDQILFDRSFIILKVSHKYDAYSSYMKMNMPMEALDQLLQAVDNYEKWLILAETCGATDEFNKAYTDVLGALSMSFNLTENDAKAINMLPTDLEYSLKVYSIVNHTEYIDPNEPLPGPFVPPVDETDETPVYEDLLEEEGNL